MTIEDKHIALGDDYDAYVRSHNFLTSYHHAKGQVGVTYECSCGAIRLNPNGTIDFHFGCALVKVAKEEA